MMAASLDDIRSRLSSGAVLAPGDAEVLWANRDIISLGMLADEARRQRHADRATFVRVADVAVDTTETAAWPESAGEIRLVGWPAGADEAVDAVRLAVHRAGGTPVTGFSLAHLCAFAGSRGGLQALVARLVAAGLDAVAEAPLDVVPDCRNSVEAVLRAGGQIARFTVQRSVQPSPVKMMADVRALQKATGAVRAFAPLPREIDQLQPTTGYDDARTIALARLVADNVPSIQVDWSIYGPKLAQVALLFGADDLDAVPASDEAPDGHRRSPLEEVRRNVRAASLVPVERDGRFAIRQA